MADAPAVSFAPQTVGKGVTLTAAQASALVDKYAAERQNADWQKQVNEGARKSQEDLRNGYGRMLADERAHLPGLEDAVQRAQDAEKVAEEAAQKATQALGAAVQGVNHLLETPRFWLPIDNMTEIAGKALIELLSAPLTGGASEAGELEGLAEWWHQGKELKEVYDKGKEMYEVGKNVAEVGKGFPDIGMDWSSERISEYGAELDAKTTKFFDEEGLAIDRHLEHGRTQLRDAFGKAGDAKAKQEAAEKDLEEKKKATREAKAALAGAQQRIAVYQKGAAP